MFSGISHCSDPTTHFWFNPVEVLLDELLAGASVALPNEVNDILTILRLASHIMFGFFLTGLVLNCILMLIAPVVIYSRWWSLPFSVFSFISTLLVLVASALGTAMSFVFKYAMNSQPDLNIRAEIGLNMLVFMWIATGFTVISFIIHMGLCCCCASRRDIKTGRKGGRHVESGTSNARNEKGTKDEKKGLKLPTFNRVKRNERNEQPPEQ
ncbi:putative integral membrane protein [Eutypa lata UCREL1]|uniref:Putative integral membrane protein n=1 Tax=Eutypa lata (strain UCR-EL1) TaxID=1287681 RepID=M7TG87_EUTLA|nr:putative integral membrane protein [Eutypa lata UCREL1]